VIAKNLISLANACERLSVDCGDHRALNNTLASIRGGGSKSRLGKKQAEKLIK